jgi:hypothetical protein
MRKPALVLCLLALVTVLASAPAAAQASRTWVSGTGSDSNPCSRTLPCLTFAVALAATTAGGEINVLDPGGFGSVAINKSVSIYNDGAGEAGIVVSGVNAIVINAGANDVINLRGLTLNGSASGPTGVFIQSAGRVAIQNCVIQQFGTGVNVQTNTTVKLKIQDTTIINDGNGVSIQPFGGIANVAIERSRIDSNSGLGVIANGISGGTTYLAMTDSSVSLNGTAGVLAASGASGLGIATLMRNNIIGNQQAGVVSDGSGGAVALAAVGDSLLAHNFGGAVQRVSNGALFSFGTNQIIGQIGTGFSATIPRQ